jgi:hypothetical protein
MLNTSNWIDRQVLLWLMYLLILPLLLALGSLSCTTEGGDEAAGSGTGDIAGDDMSGFNFTPRQTSNIIGNVMHEVHTDTAQIACRECHRDPDEFLTHQLALELCLKCHTQQIVAVDVWNNHCLSCHQFVKYKENYADSTHILRELCQDCHGEGSVYYRAFAPGSPHDITCTNCHAPHKTALVIAEGICEGCHQDIASLITPDNKIHGSCIVCHTPHSAVPDSETLCGKCHIATDNILVHAVPEHPKDCLACHQAHFTEAEILNDSCLICHEEPYYGGREDLPYAHQDCHSCHFTGSFKYMGDRQCATCHEQEGEALTNDALPREHKVCTTCHLPHSWYINFENNCDRCHDVENVIEHRLAFHKDDCGACHDPHHIDLMARSGDCDGCHGAGSYPAFDTGLSDPHLQCDNCHSEVAIASRKFQPSAPEDTCMVCHQNAGNGEAAGWNQAPSGHKLCHACHTAHVFKTTYDTTQCGDCHVGLYSQFPSAEHSDCFNCHETGHINAFVGQDNSCFFCHGELLEGHVPSSKRDCMACHQEHDFHVEDNACASCHPGESAAAAGTAHPGCTTCHQHNVWTADSAICSTCHANPPGLHEVGMHQKCVDCHDSHTSAVDLGLCRLCHAELPDSCTSPQCTDCHGFVEPGR